MSRLFQFLLLFCLSLPVQAQENAIRPVVTEIISIQSGLTESWVGTVAAEREFDLGFPQIGTVAERSANLGDLIETGEVVARQDPEDLDAAIRGAQAGVVAAEAQLRTAQDSLDRSVDLYDKGVDTSATVQHRENALAVAQANLEQAKALLVQVQDNREYADLRAPENAVVTKVYVDAGATVSGGEPVLRIASTGNREILIDLSESDAARLKKGARFHVHLQANPDVSATANLASIEPVANRTTRTRRAHLSLDHAAPEGFRLGALTLVLPTTETDLEMSLPEQAIVEGDGPPSVWVVKKESRQVERREIGTGPRAGGRIMVVSGLSPGEEVIVRGVNSIEENQQVGPGIER